MRLIKRKEKKREYIIHKTQLSAKKESSFKGHCLKSSLVKWELTRLLLSLETMQF